MSIDAGEIVNNAKLLGIFTKQFAVRMNNGNRYSREKITMALMDLANVR